MSDRARRVFFVWQWTMAVVGFVVGSLALNVGLGLMLAFGFPLFSVMAVDFVHWWRYERRGER
jgi:hypothetical protein